MRVSNFRTSFGDRNNQSTIIRHRRIERDQLPIQWLKGTGNASDAIDILVEAAKKGGLFSNTTHDWKAKELSASNNMYEQKIKDLEINLEETQLELSRVRSQLQTEKALPLDMSNLHHDHDCLSDGFKAAEILKEALTLKPNAGGAIKEKIR